MIRAVSGKARVSRDSAYFASAGLLNSYSLGQTYRCGNIGASDSLWRGIEEIEGRRFAYSAQGFRIQLQTLLINDCSPH